MKTKLMAIALVATFSVLSMSIANPPVFKTKIEIEAPIEDVWRALITPSIVERYHLAPLLKVELKKGGSIVYGTEDEVMISGRITQITPVESLTHTFLFGAENHSGTDTDGETVVTYQLTRNSDNTELTLTHSGFDSENQTYANVAGGWPHILANMKSTIEAEQGESLKP